jgi:hypothetical protein
MKRYFYWRKKEYRMCRSCKVKQKNVEHVMECRKKIEIRELRKEKEIM